MAFSFSLPFLLLFTLSTYYINPALPDSGPLQDICPTATLSEKNNIFLNGFLCKNPTTVAASDFKTSRLNHAGDTDNFLQSSVNLLTAADFPGLNTLALSIARTDLAIGGLVFPHSHPRASEMFYVNSGVIIAGFIDTKGRLFQVLLKAGDVFVFPRGLLHFSLNAGFELATAFSVLNSQNPGVVRVADAMFMPASRVAERFVRELVAGIRNQTVGNEGAFKRFPFLDVAQ